MLIHWIWLAERPTLSCRMKWELLQHFSDPEEIYYADADALGAIRDLKEEGKTALLDKDLADAEAVLDTCSRERIHILTIRDVGYPERLKNIFDPPIVLYYKGTLPDFESLPVIGIVGTRHPSVYGTQVARRMGYEIAASGGLVVSGLAHGIDGTAMRSALMAQKSTVGVLGCGADIVYPPRNRDLFAYVERYGCILSEYTPGTPPYRGNFPRRNRIISGLSNGVVVVEAPEKSGSLITARQANEQGRDVFVVPGNVDASGFTGSNRLLRSGAIAVSCGWDVVSEYEYLYPGKIRKAEPAENLVPGGGKALLEDAEKSDAKVAQKPKKPVQSSSTDEKINKKRIDNGSTEPYIDLNDILTGLTEDEKIIVSAIKEPEQLIDDVMQVVDMSPGKILAIMTILEMKGKIRRLPGRRVSLAGKP